MNRRTFLLSTAALATFGFAASYFSSPRSGLPDLGISAANAQDAAIDVPVLTLGDPDAPVKIIEYASYTCPHCANFHTQVFEQLKADYIDTGMVHFTYREVYFDKFGLWASMVARCGGDLRYFGIQKMLYDEQRDWIGSGKDAMEIVGNLRKIGKRAGLSDENLDTCLNDGAMAQALVANFEKEVAEYEVNSTPTLIIDGKKESNMSYTDLKKIIDAKLA
ncbi:DsbA family protein [Celeribacter arenosi]|uniref:DsbA family protein n=1 Tax=Celeribacter arenosi TaxID=792649 RepID=A0ABP7JWT8_9RHOB